MTRQLLILAFLFLALGIGCKKKSAGTYSAAASADPGGGGGGARNSNYDSGAGAVQNVRNAVQRKAVESNQMAQIRLFIDTASGASGRMPSPAETTAAIKQEAPAIAALIADGTIVIHPAKNREDVWAYEAKAMESSGWVATSAGVETMDSHTLKARLNR
jgi:hypothetical protein